MATINYADKVALDINPDIADINKVNASDMNLLKQVGNQTLKTIGVFTDDWSSSATYAVKDIVIYDNRVFENLTGNNTATPPDQDTTNWEETTIAKLSAGVNIPIQNTAPDNPEEDDLWIDTSEPEEMQEAIVNEYSENTNETYSCDYVNDTINGIIESGSANNGTYIKFFDGTLICRGSLGPITTNAGTGTDLTVTLPYNFKDKWFDLTASIVDGQAYWGQIQFSFITLSGSQFKFVVWNNSGGINASQYFSYIAIGRWK